MKKQSLIYLFSATLLFAGNAAQAQKEYDDLYFGANDRTKVAYSKNETIKPSTMEGWKDESMRSKFSNPDYQGTTADTRALPYFRKNIDRPVNFNTLYANNCNNNMGFWNNSMFRIGMGSMMMGFGNNAMMGFGNSMMGFGNPYMMNDPFMSPMQMRMMGMNGYGMGMGGFNNFGTMNVWGMNPYGMSGFNNFGTMNVWGNGYNNYGSPYGSSIIVDNTAQRQTVYGGRTDRSSAYSGSGASNDYSRGGRTDQQTGGRASQYTDSQNGTGRSSADYHYNSQQNTQNNNNSWGSQQNQQGRSNDSSNPWGSNGRGSSYGTDRSSGSSSGSSGGGGGRSSGGGGGSSSGGSSGGGGRSGRGGGR